MAIISRAELRAKFEFTRVNVDNLITKIEGIAIMYNHPVSQVGIISMLDEFVTNKRVNLEMMVQHPDYNNNLQIVKREDFSRDVDEEGVRTILRHFVRNIHAKQKLVKETDPEGRTYLQRLDEEIMALPRTISINSFGTDALKPLEVINDFDNLNRYIPSVRRFNEYENIIDAFSYYNETLLDEETASKINEINPKMKLVAGQKCGKAFMKAARLYGLDNDEEFKHYYPQYGDAITKVKKKNIYVISLNPIDFLTMSFGNTWGSCHTIDKNNTRNKPNSYRGMYCGGTLSYMLDEVSFVTYVINTHGSMETPEDSDKIYRNMMHYQDGILIQGRVYPQAKDGATDLYEKLRNLFQTTINECLGKGSNTSGWLKKKDSASYYNGTLYESRGVHYRDYTCFNYCTASKIKEMPDKKITIGHTGICIKCGRPIDEQSYISHSHGCTAPVEPRSAE